MSEFADHFSRAAAGYAAFRPTYPRELVDALAALAPAHGLAWDVGAGSGQLSTLLAERFERVIATEPSAEQLARTAPHPRVEYRVETAAPTSLRTASADLITAAQAAHWFDLARFYPEVRRVAKPGAVLALIAYRTGEVDTELAPLFSRFYGEVLAPHWDPARRHVESGYAEFDFPFDELAFPALAIEAELDAHAFLGYVNTWSAVGALLRAGRRAELERFQSDVLTLWGPPERLRPIRWPLAGRIGRV